jgi:hypothetical protein
MPDEDMRPDEARLEREGQAECMARGNPRLDVMEHVKNASFANAFALGVPNRNLIGSSPLAYIAPLLLFFSAYIFRYVTTVAFSLPLALPLPPTLSRGMSRWPAFSVALPRRCLIRLVSSSGIIGWRGPS